MNKDTIFSTPQSTKPFEFDRSVAAVFPDMISRSVPGYGVILEGIGELAAAYHQPKSHLYDLGCSLGAASLAMRRHLPEDCACTIIGVDNSQAMLDRADDYLHAFRSPIPIELICADLQNVAIENASLVVMNFTLQFIEPQSRQALINRIYQGLNPGGLLVISEKVHFENADIQGLIEHLHLQFKRANGYSELEISQKRASLDNVLVSDTTETHFDRFKVAGFSHWAVWHQTYNFLSMVAVK